MELAERIQQLFDNPPGEFTDEHFALFDEFKQRLNAGEVRAAEKRDGEWRVNFWVKQGILLGFRMGRIENFSINNQFRFYDKHTYPLKHLTADSGVRVVPGGSSLRDGCYIASGVTCMPPMYVNVGAYVDEGTMIDSHALVGSCAQVGRRVHISAAAQIGGVLEPIGQMPVIIEDDVLVGGNCGVYEGAIVRERAVLAPGTILTGGTVVYDLVRDEFYRKTAAAPLEIPAGAVVVPGTRAVTKGRGPEFGMAIYTPIIVKYRDEKTDAAVRLEDFLR
ncbi:MAG TPA: 2,3,4,5-tetrahydropyridine-2,6-dicarboxylate N-succinyltransferase [Blastocatellia bacterium]|nr:2,3,4,5-tetrahydropyridine-2,6-dicarboxylate N-succinyltransferase [Blastocatellia bacterium]